MTYRQSFRKSRLAEWGFRLSVVSAHLIVFTVLLHRYASQSTAVSLNLLQIGFIGAFAALIISLIASVQIWNKLLSGFGKSVAGVCISLLVLAWPIYQLPLYFTTSQINDVSTDLRTPPQFRALLQFRAFGSNASNFVERLAFAEDVRPLRILKSGQDSFDLVRQLVLKRKWKLVSVRPPGSGEADGFIEAVDLSPILAAPDDIVIRIKSRANQSILDMRSQSRYGSFDLGRNERRIQSFLTDLINQNSDIARVGEGETLFLAPRKKAKNKKKTKVRNTATKRK